MSQSPSLATGRRVPLVDAARGAALLAMASYHTVWDLQFLHLAPVDAVGSPFWRTYAQGIAATFLMLVGASLVLASRDGVRLEPFLRRLALVGGAAAIITLATLFTTPDSFIFFGILHCIAASSVLALPFLRLPIGAVLATAVAVIALPHVFTAPLFDAGPLRWLGLGTMPPRTNDFVPIFPWFGPVLVGVALARLALGLQGDGQAWWQRWRAESTLSRALAWAGRRSLPIYLVHQPLIIGLLWLVLQVTGPSTTAETASFVRSCERSCVATGEPAGQCRAGCTCTADALKGDGLWRAAMAGRLSGADEVRVLILSQQCRRGG